MPDPQQAIRVEVPGMGLVEFPAGTPQEVMAAAIRQHLDSQTPALQKFASNAWDMVNPMGLINAGLHPVDTAKAIYQSHVDQAGKAYDAFQRAKTEPLYGGVLPLSGIEAVGHGLATVLPIVGPAAASAGEDIGSGQYAKGLGKATGLLAGAAFGSKVPEAVLKVAKAPVAVADYLNQPSIMAARRNARVATQDVAEATNLAKYDARAAARLDRYNVAKQAHDANQIATEAAARQLHAAEEAVYNADTQARHDVALKQWEVKKAAYDAATDAQKRTAAAEHQARIAAADQTALSKEEWVAARQAAADTHAQGVQENVAAKLGEMEPTDIVTDRRRPAPPGSPEGTPGELFTTQFQLPSAATRAATDAAAKLRLLQQTGVEVPRPQGGPTVPDLPLQPAPAIPDLVLPERGPFPDFAPPQRAPFESYVPPAQKTFPAYAPPEAYTPLPREVLPPAFGPQTRGGELAALAGAGLLGKSAIGNLWDKFFQ